MAWQTVEYGEYTSLQHNLGEGYYVYLYANPDDDSCSEAIFLHEDRGMALRMYKDIMKTVEIMRKLWKVGQ